MKRGTEQMSLAIFRHITLDVPRLESMLKEQNIEKITLKEFHRNPSKNIASYGVCIRVLFPIK